MLGVNTIVPLHTYTTEQWTPCVLPPACGEFAAELCAQNTKHVKSESGVFLCMFACKLKKQLTLKLIWNWEASNIGDSLSDNAAGVKPTMAEIMWELYWNFDIPQQNLNGFPLFGSHPLRKTNESNFPVSSKVSGVLCDKKKLPPSLQQQDLTLNPSLGA